MCEFKPGDEVVPIKINPDDPGYRNRVKIANRVHIVEYVGVWSGVVFVRLVGQDSGHPCGGWNARGFRKVQRRDISQWLETATDFEEPKRKKAKA